MKIFIDTAPFIYLIENHPQYGKTIFEFIAHSILEGNSFGSSVITLLEFGVKPERENKPEIISNFRNLLRKLNINLLPIDEFVVKRAYELRAKYGFLKSMDAIQIASSLLIDCDQFVTNDKKLKRIDEITVLVIDDLI